jgi:DNA-binding XRE family transcriptional regulator
MNTLKVIWNFLFGSSKYKLWLDVEKEKVRLMDIKISEWEKEGKILREKMHSDYMSQIEPIEIDRRDTAKKYFDLLQHCDILEAEILKLKRENETQLVTLSDRIDFTMLTSKIVAEVIRNSRTKLAYTPHELAKILKIPISTYSKIESGKSKITIDQIALISVVLLYLPSEIIHLADRLRKESFSMKTTITSDDKPETKNEDC